MLRHLGSKDFSRWVRKIMTFTGACFHLMSLPSSRQLRPVITGRIHFIGVPNHNPSRYTVDLTEPAILGVLQSIIPLQPTVSSDSSVETFAKHLATIRRLLGIREFTERPKASVHAEIVLLLWLLQHTPNAYPYIGVSKLSCFACQEYIRLFNLDQSQAFTTTNGSHGGKFYPDWVFLASEGTTANMRHTLVESLQRILIDDLQAYVKKRSQWDSTVASSKYVTLEKSEPFTFRKRSINVGRNETGEDDG